MDLEPLRGMILDRNLKPLSINLPCESLYASPNQIKNKEKVAHVLSNALGLGYDYLKSKLYRDKGFVWIYRKLSPEAAGKIKKLKIEGLGFIHESKRRYPNKNYAAHLIGFSGLDNTGLEGLELYHDGYLKGAPGWAQVLRDARQNKLLVSKMILPKDGLNLVLTIDEFIQFIAERELDKTYEKFHAQGASIIVMDPRTGEVLALANRPSYDLNSPGKASQDTRRNRAICDMFEPGSVFKIVTASAALEENKFKESDRFFCENGAYRVANHILHDHHPHGWLTFREVILESSNIGTTKIAQALGPDKIYEYATRFGFGKKLGVDLPGEISGVLKEPRIWSKTSIGAVPIGQEVGVTALQLASAISAVANGGVLMKPYILKSIQDTNGQKIKEFVPIAIRRVISENTARRVKDILASVVEDGTGKMAKTPDFKIAGKTGTAQKLDPGGAYSHSKYMASFIGFAPADNPLVAIVVIVDEPHPYYFGGVVAAPVFKYVAQDTVKYLKMKGREQSGG